MLMMLFSCTKDELTKPVAVELLLEMKNSEGGQGSNGFDVGGAQFIINEVGFEGYRESGENYFFTKSFPEAQKVSFTKTGGGRVLAFDMPQGVYNRMDIKMQVPAGKEPVQLGEIIDRTKLQGGIEIWGTYTNAHGVALPFLFVYTALDQMQYTAQSAAGKQQLTIKEKSRYQAKLKFDPQHWMQLINPRMLQSAKLSTISGVPTVVISKTQNEQVYKLLASRIKESAHLLVE